MIKFLRTLFATALARKEKKEEIMVQFKSVLYARDSDSFKVSHEKFLKTCLAIEVHTNDAYGKLDAYFTKNWSSCIHMWEKHMQKNLPTLENHTTNHVKSMFWSLKRSLREKFISLRKTVSSEFDLEFYHL